MATQHEVRVQAQLSGGYGGGSSVVGLGTAAGDDAVTPPLESIGQ